MTPAELRRSIKIDFGVAGNGHEFVIDGWSDAEAEHRWTTGKRSSIKVSPLGFSNGAYLTFVAAPYLHTDKVPVQNLSIFWNGSKVDEFVLTEGRRHYAVLVPPAVISSSESNIIELHHPNAARPRDVGGGGDSRQLAISFSSLSIEPEDLRLGHPGRLLPDDTDTPLQASQLQSLAQRFQSLGQNCELGLFQRRCGAEPLGLFRFASIFLPHLLEGIETRFSGIGNVADISFTAEKGGEEYIGRHRVYGLDYHTFTKPGQVEIAAFTKSEAVRMNYLARLLMEQIENAERIFVIQRRIPSLALREIIPLLRTLRSRNEKTVLFWVTETGPGDTRLAGRVECLSPNLYHGYIDRLAPGDNAHDLSVELWVKLCRTVVKALEAPPSA
jgi:hypothetical protein